MDAALPGSESYTPEEVFSHLSSCPTLFWRQDAGGKPKIFDDFNRSVDERLEAVVRPPGPEQDAEVLRAYMALRGQIAGEAILTLATGEGAQVAEIVRFYALDASCTPIEGVEALLSTLGTLDEESPLLGVGATTADRVLLVITDAEMRYLAHVLQPFQLLA